MTTTEKILAKIEEGMADGWDVLVETAYRQTRYNAKTHADWFSIGKDGCLYVRAGRGKDCLSMANGCLLVGISFIRKSK